MAFTFNEMLSIKAAKLIDEAIEAEKDILAAGNLANFDTYRFHAGIVQGLRVAKKAVETANDEIQRQ